MNLLQPSQVLLIAVLITNAAACRPRPPVPVTQAICASEVLGDEAVEVQQRSLPAELWYSLLLSDFDRKNKQLRQGGKDCRGQSIANVESSPEFDCPGLPLEPDPLTNEVIADTEQMLQTSLESGQLLIWAPVRRFLSGASLGPVALIDWTERGVAVNALGHLRAFPNRANMRLEQMNENRLLVVESERCDDKGKTCDSLVKLMPLRGDKFVEVPLIDDQGQCLGRSEMLLSKTHDAQLDSGWIRRFVLVRNLLFENDHAVIFEKVTIRDHDPSQPDLPPKTFREASLERQLNLSGRGLATQASLWESMLAEHGSVRPTNGSASTNSATIPGAK